MGTWFSKEAAITVDSGELKDFKTWYACNENKGYESLCRRGYGYRIYPSEKWTRYALGPGRMLGNLIHHNKGTIDGYERQFYRAVDLKYHLAPPSKSQDDYGTPTNDKILEIINDPKFASRMRARLYLIQNFDEDVWSKSLTDEKVLDQVKVPDDFCPKVEPCRPKELCKGCPNYESLPDYSNLGEDDSLSLIPDEFKQPTPEPKDEPEDQPDTESDTEPDQPDADQPDADQPDADQPDADQPDADQPGDDQVKKDKKKTDYTYYYIGGGVALAIVLLIIIYMMIR
jgi:hypothetical protein